jgi:hypothetical protein
LEILSVKYSADRKVLTPISLVDISSYIPLWDTLTSNSNGDMTNYILDYETGKIRLYPVPLAATTVYLTVSRLPLVDLDYTQQSVSPEIKSQYHYYLPDGILYHAYQKDDDNTLDLQQSERYRNLWEQNIEYIRIEENRYKHYQNCNRVPFMFRW